MQAKPVSVQLYSLRAEAATDFVGVLKRLAKVGYCGVEPAGFHNLSAQEFRNIVDELGMKVSSAHGVCPISMPVQQAVDTAGILGIDTLCSGFWISDFATLEAIKATAEKVTKAIEAIEPFGLKLMLHNHWAEFEVVDGRLAYDWFAELCPKALFEIDTYWASNFGANNPAEQVAKFRARTPFLHLKDGPLTHDVPMVAVGSGKMDIPAVVKAADPQVLRWLVVELDECATDMFQAVEDSYHYLVNNGLGAGASVRA